MVSVDNRGSAWVSDEVAGIDIVRSFYQNFATQIAAGQGEGSFYGGMMRNMVGMLQHGMPLYTKQTTQSRVAGKAMGSGRRSTVEPADWHDLNEHRFARTVAGAIERVMRERKVPALVIVAPPRTLADLRNALHADVAARVIAEVNKDLTRHPVSEIEKHLTGG